MTKYMGRINKDTVINNEAAKYLVEFATLAGFNNLKYSDLEGNKIQLSLSCWDDNYALLLNTKGISIADNLDWDTQVNVKGKIKILKGEKNKCVDLINKLLLCLFGFELGVFPEVAVTIGEIASC